ncbi:MAG: hypothetical protein ACE5EH_01385 [Gammaproteobacteria bacterium]
MTKKLPGFFAAVLFSGFASSSFGAIIANSTFDTYLDGWTAISGQTTSVSFSAPGGNPGGYVRNVDSGPTGGHISAPTKFLGDWSSLDGTGTLSWDFKLFSKGPGNIKPLRAHLFGPGGSASFNSGVIAPVGNWITVDAAIIESQWTLVSGTWAGLLANVTSLRLAIENVSDAGLAGGGSEITGIDNVALTAVPLPAAFWLFGAGLVTLFRFRSKTPSV